MTDVDRRSEPSSEGLLALLAHDLRAPLAPLSLASSWLATDESSSEDSRALARIADAQGDKMRRLIDAALIASGRTPSMRVERTPLAAVMRDAERIHRALGGLVSSPPADAVVAGDQSLLRDAMANLFECGGGEGGAVLVDVPDDPVLALVVIGCRNVEACASAIRGAAPSDALSAFLLGSKAILELHDGGLELIEKGLIAWLPRTPS